MDGYPWSEWERLITIRGIEIDRPKGSAHPRYPDLIYPVDYGYLPETTGGDGAEIDIFAGDADTGLTGIFLTEDSLKGDREIKLLWNLAEDDVATIARLLNTGAMRATLIRRKLPDGLSEPRTFGELLDRLGELGDDYDDFMRDRPMNEIHQERRLFEDEDDPENEYFQDVGDPR